LDEGEQSVFDRLRRLASANGSLDVVMLLEDSTIRDAGPQGDVWAVLEQLYRKRRVSVHVSAHHAIGQP
jgi:hypothetical protein